MAFERLLRLTKKCPGYVVSELRNASVGIATVTQESFESQYYITRALFGTRSLFTMTTPLSNPEFRVSWLESIPVSVKDIKKETDKDKILTRVRHLTEWLA